MYLTLVFFAHKQLVSIITFCESKLSRSGAKYWSGLNLSVALIKTIGYDIYSQILEMCIKSIDWYTRKDQIWYFQRKFEFCTSL